MRTDLGSEKGTARHVASLLLCMTLAAAMAGSNAQVRPGMSRGQNRLLLLFAPNPTDKQYTAQIGMLRGKEAGLAARQLVTYDLFGPGHMSRQGHNLLPASCADVMRGRYQIPVGRFTLVLVGKDGNEAFRSERPLAASQLFTRIDAMPMRHEEMQRMGGNPQGMAPPPPGPGALLPGPKLSPVQVVWAQLYALQRNDKPKPDSGIATTFAFASPNNRRATGPLPHFISIVKNAQYLPMFLYKRAAFPTVHVQGDHTMVPVRLSDGKGHVAFYLFELSRQHLSPFKDCWMTDGVIRVPGPNRNVNI